MRSLTRTVPDTADEELGFSGPDVPVETVGSANPAQEEVGTQVQVIRAAVNVILHHLSVQGEQQTTTNPLYLLKQSI